MAKKQNKNNNGVKPEIKDTDNNEQQVVNPENETKNMDDVLKDLCDIDVSVEMEQLKAILGHDDLIDKLYKIEYFAARYHNVITEVSSNDTKIEKVEWDDTEALEYILSKFQPNSDKSKNTFIQYICNTLKLINVDKNDLIGYFGDTIISTKEDEPLSELDIITSKLEVLLDDVSSKDFVDILMPVYPSTKDFFKAKEDLEKKCQDKFNKSISDLMAEDILSALELMEIEEYYDCIALFRSESAMNKFKELAEKANAQSPLYPDRFNVVVKSLQKIFTVVAEEPKDEVPVDAPPKIVSGSEFIKELKSKIKLCKNEQVAALLVHVALTSLDVEKGWEVVEKGEIDRFTANHKLRVHYKDDEIKTEENFNDILKLAEVKPIAIA